MERKADDQAPARRRYRSSVARAPRLQVRVYPLGQSHHVHLRRCPRDESRSRACTPRSSGGPHGRCVGTSHRRSRYRAGHRRARPRKRGRRSLHLARRRVADGTAVGTRSYLGARPWRLPGNPASRHGGTRDQSFLDGHVCGKPGLRPRQGDPDRHVRAARPGPCQLAIGSSRGAGRKQRNCLAGYAESRRDGAGAPGRGRRCHTRGHRRRRTAGDPRRPATIEHQRTRTPRQTGGSDQGASRDPGEPTRHRRRHARGVSGSGAALRSDRASRQGSGLHDPVGIGPGIRSRRATDRDRSRGGAGRARRKGEGRPPALELHRRRPQRRGNARSPAPQWSRRAPAIG